MAWTIAIIIATLGLGFLIAILNNSFEKNNHGIKVFLTMLTLSITVLISQIIKLIIEDKASAGNLANLQKLATTNLIITITILSVFTMYFLITYTIGIIKSMKDAKKNKITDVWGEI